MKTLRQLNLKPIAFGYIHVGCHDLMRNRIISVVVAALYREDLESCSLRLLENVKTILAMKVWNGSVSGRSLDLESREMV